MTLCKLCKYHFYKSFLQMRTLFAALLVIALVHMFSTPFQKLCQMQGIRCSLLPLFTLIGDNYMASALLFCIWVFWMSGIPFIDKSQNLIMARATYSQWCGGTILYTVCTSMLYWIFVLLTTFAVMLPYTDFSLTWGEFYMALNRGAGQSMIGMFFVFSKKAQQLYTAVQACALSGSLHVLVSMALAMVMFAMNLHKGKLSGNIMALMLIFFDFCFRGLGMPYFVYYFSPVSLCNIDMLDATGTTFLPSVGYAYGFLAGMALLLSIIVRLRGTRRGASVFE